MPKTATLFRMVTDQHTCPYGIKSKDLLRRHGYEVEDHLLETRGQTESFKHEHHVKTTPQTFIGEERVGGYDDLREFFGMKSKQEEREKPTYAPVLAVFGVSLLVSLATVWRLSAALSPIPVLEFFVAFSMTVLGTLKLRDLDSFSNQFLSYDLLAQKWVPYAYIYPFVETLAGVAMIARLGIPVFATAALFIGAVGAVSVVKAVYIDHRDLKCACVGGGSNVPLGFISLTENLMMVAMSIWMLAGKS